MLESIDAAAVRRWAAACVAALETHQIDIDRINVFPVADADTGTNLLLTMRSALDALVRGEPTNAGDALARLARGALAGARGNSGVILSQILRGLAEAARGCAVVTGVELRAGLSRAHELAVRAVTTPVPGTVLDVLHAAARAAADQGVGPLCTLVEVVCTAAREALARTPDRLADLARAGVVDAGGRGLVLLLEVLVGVVEGRAEPQEIRRAPLRVPRPPQALLGAREGGSADYEYEVMYLLDRTDEARATALRTELTRLGDCVSVVGDGEPGGTGLWTVHVHCNDVGAAIEAGIEAGRPHRITVVRFAGQVAEEPVAPDRAVVALASGEGIAELFRSAGATVLTGEPTAADLLEAISGTRARHVVVLPNDLARTPTAELAAEHALQAGQDVIVVPTASPVQGLAAVAVHDVQRRPGDDVVAMAEAAAATRRGELLVAASEALTWAGRCYPGDILGMADGDVVLIGRDGDVVGTACQLADRLLAVGGELLTALLGADAPPELGEALQEHLRRSHPEIEVMVYPGGQQDTLLLIGVE